MAVALVVPTCPHVSVPQVRPCSTRFTFRTGRQVPRLGVMLVGWGGNNGTTVTAAVLANKLGLSWMTKTGRKVGVPWPWQGWGWGHRAQLLPSPPGSCTPIFSLPLQRWSAAPAPPAVWGGPPHGGGSSSHSPSQKANYYGSLLQASTVCLGTGPAGDVYVPFRDLLPMVHPNDIVFDGRWDTGGNPRWGGGS